MKTKRFLKLIALSAFFGTTTLISCDNNDLTTVKENYGELQAIEKGDVVRPQDRD